MKKTNNVTANKSEVEENIPSPKNQDGIMNFLFDSKSEDQKKDFSFYLKISLFFVALSVFFLLFCYCFLKICGIIPSSRRNMKKN